MPSNSNFGSGQGKPLITTEQIKEKHKGKLGTSIRGKFIVYKIYNPNREKVRLEGAQGSYFEILGLGTAIVKPEDYEQIKAEVGLDRLITSGLKISGMDRNAVDKRLIELKNEEKKNGNN